MAIKKYSEYAKENNLEYSINHIGKQHINTTSSNEEKKKEKKWWQEIFQLPDAYKDNLDRFDDGYDFGDIIGTAGETVFDTGKVALGTTADIFTNALEGVADVGEGLGDLLAYGGAQILDWAGNDDYADQVREHASENLMDKLFNPINNSLDKHSILGNTGDSVFELAGYSLGLTAGNALGKAGNVSVGKLKVPTLAVTGGTSSSLGSTYSSEEYKEGNVNDVQAWTRGIGSGAIEGITESLFGLFGVGGNEITDTFAKNVANKFTSGVAKTLAKTGVQATGEGIEEFLSYAGNQGLDFLIDKVSGENNPNFYKEWDWEEVGEQIGIAFLSAGISQGGSTVFQVAQETKKAEQKAQEQLGRELTKEEKASIKEQVTNAVINNEAVNTENTTQTKINELLQDENKTSVYQYETSENEKTNIMNESASKYFNNSEEAHNLTKVAEKLIEDKGYKIIFDDTIVNKAGKSVNAQITNANNEIEIRINPNSDRAGEFLLMHEVTHAIETDAIKNLIIDYASKNEKFKTHLEELQRTYNVEDVTPEVIADISGELFGNQEFINNLSVQQPSVFRKIYDAIISLVNKITGNSKYDKFVKDLKNKWESAYRTTTTEQAVSNIEEKVFYSINKNFSTEYDNWDKKTRQGNFILGRTSKALKSIGLESRDIIIDRAKLLKIKNDHPEMTDEVIKKIPEVLENPTLILKSQSVNGRIVIFSEINTANGTPMLIAMELNPAENKASVDKIYKVASAYGRQNVKHMQNWLNNPSNILYVDNKKNRTSKWLSGLGLQLPVPSTTSGSSANNIPQNNQKVKSGTKSNTKYSMQESTDSTQSLKQKQLDIILNNNPALDEYHTWIRSLEDIKTFEEALNDSDWVDYKGKDFDESYSYSIVEEALDTGKITVYSSYPIEQGIFVTPSKMEAESYSGDGKVYSKEVNLTDVAWIDPTQGQYAKVETKNNTQVDNKGRTLTKEQQEFFKDSKVRDNEGNLLTVYHGTDADFTVFNNPEQDFYNYQSGKMFQNTSIAFFTDSEEVAKTYTENGNLKEVYLDIKNPYIVDAQYQSNQLLEPTVDTKLIETINNLSTEEKKQISDIANSRTGFTATDWSEVTLGQEILSKINDFEPQTIFNIARDDYSKSVINSFATKYKSVNRIVEEIYKNGKYDGVIIKNVADEGFFGEYDLVDGNQYATDYIIFNSNQVKNVDNTNPTSSEDIRYSEEKPPTWREFLEENFKATGTRTDMREILQVKEQVEEAIAPIRESITELTSIIEELREDVAPASLNVVQEEARNSLNSYPEELIPETDGNFAFNEETTVDTKNKNDITSYIKDTFGINRQEARELYNKIASLTNKNSAIEEVYSLIEPYREINQAIMSEDNKQIKQHIKGTSINISELKSQFLSDEEFNAFRRSNFGSLKLSNDGQSIDVVYQELSNLYPSIFPSDIVNPLDQLEYVSDYMKTDNSIIEEHTLTDSELTTIAERLLSDIGNKERYDAGLDQSWRSKKAMKNELGYIPKDPTRESSYDNTIEREPLLEALSDRYDGTFGKSEPKVKKTKTLESIYEKLVNRNVKIDKMAKETGNQNIKYAGDMLSAVFGEVDGNINVAQIDSEGNVVGSSLTSLFQASKKGNYYEALDDYLKHYSNIDRHHQKKGSKVPLEYSEQMVAEYEKTYPNIKSEAYKIWEYGDNLLIDMKNNGLVSEDLYNYLREIYPHYVPYMEEEDYTPYMADNGVVEPKRVVKKAKGEARKLMTIEDALAKYTYASKKAIRQNNLYKEIINTLGTSKSIEADMRVEPTDMEESLYLDKTGAFLRAYENGDSRSIRISEDLYKSLKNELEETIKNFEEEFSKITKPLQAITRVRRKLLTSWSPTFLITNAIKDIQDGVFNSKYTKDMLRYYPSALKELMQAKDSTAIQFMALYGSGNRLGEYNIEELTKNKHSILDKRSLLNFINLNNIVELAPRYAEFKASLKHGASVQEAMYNAREVTTNFTRGGVITKALDRNGVPFANASSQGLDKFIRNLTGQNGNKGYVNAVRSVAGTLLKATMLGVAPALLNDLVFGDDEDYEALPDYIKDAYYLIKISSDSSEYDDSGAVVSAGGSKFLRIPKGRALSIFGMSARRVLEYAQGEENAFEGMFNNMSNQMSPTDPGAENIFSPIIQAINNEAWYGGDIYPSYLEEVTPGYLQYDESTDNFSIWLGSITGLSPAKINYVLDQYSGGIGDFVLPWATEEATNEGGFFAPITDKFTVTSTMDNKYVSDIYSLKKELTINTNDLKATDEDVLKYKYIFDITEEMSTIYDEIEKIQNDKSLSKKEKYNKVSTFKEQLNSLAEEGLNNYENISKTSNYAIVGDREYYRTYDEEEDKYSWKKPDDDELEDLNSLGLELEEKNSYFEAKGTISSIKEEQKEEKIDSTVAKEKIGETVINANLTNDAKYYLYDKYYGDTETLDVIAGIGVKANDYIRYNSQNFEADKDANGNSISGSRKTKVFNYINSMNIEFEQKVILAKLQYTSYDEYNYELIEYLNNSNITYAEEVAILKRLGFTVYDDGTVEW